MNTDKQAKQLHDKSTRSVKLSLDDQAVLDAWYGRQDTEENAIIASSTSHETLPDLQAQVDTAVTQLLTVTQRVQVLSRQNDDLRREVATLKQQLAKTPQTA